MSKFTMPYLLFLYSLYAKMEYLNGKRNRYTFKGFIFVKIIFAAFWKWSTLSAKNLLPILFF